MKLIIKITALACLMALSACNTLKGVGQDVQKAGAVIEDAAKRK
ncbi:MAG: hypothetical protein RL459_140 [Pseudomonadota bacterium]|jgi:predicted small secreted protein